MGFGLRSMNNEQELCGDTNKMLSISYLHFLSHGRTIRTSLMQEWKIKHGSLTSILNNLQPTCVCGTKGMIPTAPSLLVIYNMFYGYLDDIPSVQRTLLFHIPPMSTVVSPHPWFHFPKFQLPAVNPSSKILNEKFHK